MSCSPTLDSAEGGEISNIGITEEVQTWPSDNHYHYRHPPTIAILRTLVLIRWLSQIHHDQADEFSDCSPTDRIPRFSSRSPTHPPTMLCDSAKPGKCSASANLEAKGRDAIQRYRICSVDWALWSWKGCSRYSAELQLWPGPRWFRTHGMWPILAGRISPAILYKTGLTYFQGGVGYFLWTDVFSPDSKTSQFNRAVDKIKADPRCLEIFGDAKNIRAHGEETMNKWRRARPVA